MTWIDHDRKNSITIVLVQVHQVVTQRLPNKKSWNCCQRGNVMEQLVTKCFIVSSITLPHLRHVLLSFGIWIRTLQPKTVSLLVRKYFAVCGITYGLYSPYMFLNHRKSEMTFYGWEIISYFGMANDTPPCSLSLKEVRAKCSKEWRELVLS